MQAKIMKYKENRTAKKALFLRNGKPHPIVEIKIGKRFELSEAKKVAEALNCL